jgi:ankyrin repeat protein
MNAAFNHGSQGDFFKKVDEKTEDLPNHSKAPAGTGEALRKAALDGSTETVAELTTKWKGDSIINEQDEIGTTALHTAASHGHEECVKLLLEGGADKTIKNHYGQTAYAKATKKEIKMLVKIPGYNLNKSEGGVSSCIIA